MLLSIVPEPALALEPALADEVAVADAVAVADDEACDWLATTGLTGLTGW